VQELFLAFLRTPTADTFRVVRDEVVRNPKYDGYSRDLDRMRAAYDQNRFAEVRTAFAEAQPNLLLSPESHFLLSLAARELGDAQGAEAEKFICFRCVDGILASGKGTREEPYPVLRTSDEYDVLRVQDKQLQSQHLVHENGRSFDRMVCTDGSEVWFDITDLFAAMARRLQG
jgi:hypothetical protein